MRRRQLVWSGTLLVLVASSAHAEDRVQHLQPTTREAADDAQFLPFSSAARSGSLVKLRGGYDGAAAKSDLHAEVQARLSNALTLQAGASYDPLSSAARPFALGRLALLQQPRVGVDLSALAGFEARSINTVPSLLFGVAIARRFGAFSLLSNLKYGQAIHSAERSGSVSFAGLVRVADRLQVGLDSQGQMDLERDADEPAGELDWRAQAGPVLIVTLGTLALSAGAGISALRYRLEPAVERGGMGYLGLGSAFNGF